MTLADLAAHHTGSVEALLSPAIGMKALGGPIPQDQMMASRGTSTQCLGWIERRAMTVTR